MSDGATGAEAQTRTQARTTAVALADVDITFRLDWRRRLPSQTSGTPFP